MERIAPEVVEKIYPLNRLPREAVDLLLPGMRVRVYAAGSELFEIGSAPQDLYYVLQGSIALTEASGGASHTIGPDQPTPMPQVIPSTHRARTTGNCKLLLIDRQRLTDVLRRYHPSSAQSMEWSYRAVATQVMPSDAAPERPGLAPADPGLTDWQKAFLKAPGFQRIAANDMRRAFELMKPVPYRAGDVVIQKGDPADYFYVIAEGRCEVLRGQGDAVVRVAEYGSGATLGEDGLVSGNLRNASVRMLTDGTLMRLDGDDFRFLIKRALLHGVEPADARQMVARGSRWLDVRLPEERTIELPGSIAIPHPLVRGRLFTANPQLSYVVVCARGFDASVIAFMLCKYGYDAYYLKGGIAELQRSGPPL